MLLAAVLTQFAVSVYALLLMRRAQKQELEMRTRLADYALMLLRDAELNEAEETWEGEIRAEE